MRNEALILFIKNPVLGRVKTRLAAGIGEERALQVYQDLLRHTREVARRVEVRRYVFYSDFIDWQDEWPESLFFKRLQEGRDLGLRMHHALDTALGRHEKAVLVGGDIPGLRPDILERAFSALEQQDVVLGPAEDGGYYLIGLKEPRLSLFEEMRWSHPRVLDDTLQRVDDAGLSCQFLETLKDVDEPQDLEAMGY